MRIEKKVWGERWMVREDSVHTSNILPIIAGYECSWHRHKEKYNLFVVIAGIMRIVYESGDDILSKSLSPGDSFTTTPGQWHKFQVIKSGFVFEEMYVLYDDNDIEREKLGGPIGE